MNSAPVGESPNRHFARGDGNHNFSSPRKKKSFSQETERGGWGGNARIVRRTRSDEPMISTRPHKSHTPQRRVRRYQSHNSNDTPLPSLPTIQMISMHVFLSYQLHYTQPPPDLASACPVVLNTHAESKNNDNMEYLRALYEQYAKALPQQHERICQGLLNKLSWTNAQKLVVLYAQQMRMHTGPECLRWIVHKAQQEPHYADMYAHFARELSQQLQAFTSSSSSLPSQVERADGVNFSSLLRDICWKEMEQSSTKAQSWLGLVRFVGASYRANPEMIPIQDYLSWLWDRILSGGKDDEIILEGLGQLLTNSQWEEQSCNTSNNRKDKTDSIWPMVQDLAKTGQYTSCDSGIDNGSITIRTSKRIQFLFQDLIDLKQNRWELKPRLVQEQARTLEEIHEQMEMEEEGGGNAMKNNSALSFLNWRSEAATTPKPAHRQNKYSNPADCARHMHSIIRVYLLNEEEPVEHVMELWTASVGEFPKDDPDYQARAVAVIADSILMALEMKSQHVQRLQALIQRVILGNGDKTTTSFLLQGLQLPLELLRDVELDAPKAVSYLGQLLAGFDISLRDLFFHATSSTWPERPGALSIQLVAVQGTSKQEDLDCIEQILEQSGEAWEHSTILEWIAQIKDSSPPQS